MKRYMEVYNFIVSYSLKHGYTPSFREIGEGVGLLSTSSVKAHMDKLTNMGYIEPVSEGSGRIKVKGLKYIYEDETEPSAGNTTESSLKEVMLGEPTAAV